MGRSKRDSTLENRTNRLKLEFRDAPRWTALAEGEHIGYYRPQTKAAGIWKAKWRDKVTEERKATSLGTADDYEDADGMRILDWAQAQKKAQTWFTKVARESRRKADGGTTHEGPFTLAHALDDYKKDCDRRGVKGAKSHAYQIEAHLRPALGEVEVGKLTRRKIEQWLDALAKSPRRVRPKKAREPKLDDPKPRVFKKPRAPKPVPPLPGPPSTADEKRARKDTANRVFSILKAALNYAHSTGAFRGDPVWKEVKPYKGTTAARTRFLSIEDQARFVNGCPADFQRLVRAALVTGARYGELTRVTAAEYSREAKTLYIPARISKSGKARHIFLTDEGQRIFEGVTAGKKGDVLIFTRDREIKRISRDGGQAWLHGDQRPYMEAACKVAGTGAFTFHELRHTAASTWIAAGMDLILVARQLGHSDTRMVEKHYGHLCPDAAAARFRAIAPELGILGTEQVAPLLIKTS